MGLVDDYGKSLAFQLLDQFLNVHELVDGSYNDFGVTVEGICQVFGSAFFIHDLDQTGLVLQ